MDDVAYMTALQAELRRSTRNELASFALRGHQTPRGW